MIYSSTGLSGVLMGFCAFMIPAPFRLMDVSVIGHENIARGDALFVLIIKPLERLSKPQLQQDELTAHIPAKIVRVSTVSRGITRCRKA